MTMRALRWGLLVLCLVSAAAEAQTLPLPGGLVDLRSEEGARLLEESDAREAFLPLSVTFVTQKNHAYCGVASIVMVLNALQLPAPAMAENSPYRSFTQDNVLDEETDRILPREVLAKQGMTLDQLGALLAAHPLEVEVHHAADADLAAFRAAARDHLARRGHFVIVNYLRKAIGQQQDGHISPLAAYDAESDRFLILDVSRYKYPPVWVAASDLFEAMNTTDADNQNKTRGYVLMRGAPTH